MRFLRKNTAVRITVGPFFDKTDGVTPEIALTVTSCKLTATVDADDGTGVTLVLDTNPTASAGSNDMVHITGDDAGYYDIELTAANTNYNGRFHLALTDAATHCPVFHEFTILPQAVYDSIVSGTDNLQVDAVQVSGTAQTARDIGASILLSSGTGTGQVSLSSGLVTLAGVTHTGAVIPTVTAVTNDVGITQAGADKTWSTATRALTDKAGFALSAAGVQAIWDALTSALTTAGSVGKKLADWVLGSDSKVLLSSNAQTGVTIPTVTTLTGHTAQTGDSYALANGANGFVAIKGDTAAILVDTGTTLDTKINNIQGATFDTATDSLEALRNRGDAAWTTATGFSTHAAADVWAVATRAITDKTGFSLAADQAVNTTKINGSATAATQLALSAATIVSGAAIAGTLSTTQMTTNLTEATDDHFNGRIIVWASGALLNQATDITDYFGADKRLVFTATTEAPSAADTFVII